MSTIRALFVVIAVLAMTTVSQAADEFEFAGTFYESDGIIVGTNGQFCGSPNIIQKVFSKGTIVSVEKWGSDESQISIKDGLSPFPAKMFWLKHRDWFGKGPMVLAGKLTVFWLANGVAPNRNALAATIKEDFRRQAIRLSESKQEDSIAFYREVRDSLLTLTYTLPLPSVSEKSEKSGDRDNSGHSAYTEKREPATSLNDALKNIDKGNVFDLDKVAQCFNVEVDSEMLQVLSSVPFSEETLQRCKNTHFLVADLGLSIEEMYSGKSEIFSKKWNEGEVAVGDRSGLCWKLLPRNGGKLTARETIYLRLLDNNWPEKATRTISGQDGRKIVVGKTRFGIFVYPAHDGWCSMPYQWADYQRISVR